MGGLRAVCFAEVSLRGPRKAKGEIRAYLSHNIQQQLGEQVDITWIHPSTETGTLAD